MWLPVLVLSAGAGAAAAQPPRTEPIHNPVHVCIATHRGLHGTLIMGVRINDLGRRFDSRVRWTSVQSPGGLSLAYLQSDLQPDDLTQIALGVDGRWRGNPRVRVVLSKSGITRNRSWEMVFGSGYRRISTGRAEVVVSLGELRAFAGGAPITVTVLKRNGEELARGWLDPAAIDAAVEAAAAVRPEIEAMAADHRNRCVQRPASEGLRI